MGEEDELRITGSKIKDYNKCMNGTKSWITYDKFHLIPDSIDKLSLLVNDSTCKECRVLILHFGKSHEMKCFLFI